MRGESQHRGVMGDAELSGTPGDQPGRDERSPSSSGGRAGGLHRRMVDGASFAPILIVELFRCHVVSLPWRYSRVRGHRTLVSTHPTATQMTLVLIHGALSDDLAERTGEVRWWATCTSPVRPAGSAVPERPTDETMPGGNSHGSASPRSACCAARRTSAPRGGSPPKTGVRCVPATWCSPTARLDTGGRRHGD